MSDYFSFFDEFRKLATNRNRNKEKFNYFFVNVLILTSNDILFVYYSHYNHAIEKKSTKKRLFSKMTLYKSYSFVINV